MSCPIYHTWNKDYRQCVELEANGTNPSAEDSVSGEIPTENSVPCP